MKSSIPIQWAQRACRAFILIVVLAMVALAPAHAQEAGGTILGTVVDPKGAAVAGATITIRNVETGVERTTTANGDGLYSAPNLQAGSYDVSVTATGFSVTSVRGIVLTVGQDREVTVKLQLGQVTEQVTVRGEQIQDVQVVSSAIGNVVDSHTVVELPLNGRDWASLALLEPGVAQVRTQKALGVGNDRPNRGLGVDATIGGNRPQGNNYRLDGVSINDYSSGAPGSITGAILGVDAVREFSVVTSNAPADFGKTSGGVINATSRSGTNSFHGTAYEFLRNSALDARNFFDSAKDSAGNLIIPPFKRNQFGASAGGPIVKDHTFFFADYEGLRQGLSLTKTITVPSQSAAQLAAADSKVLPFFALFPKPDPATITGTDPLTTGKFTFVQKQVTTEDFATVRVDHSLSASDSLSATYLFDRGNLTSPDTYNFKNIGNQSRRQTVAIEESHIFTPELLNTARLGFNRNVVIAFRTLSQINKLASDTTFGFDPGQPVGIITLGSGIDQFTGGIGASAEYDFHYNSFQAYDDLYLMRGKHALKFGFYAERIQSNQFSQGANPNGFYIFGGLSNFLQNKPTSFTSLLGASHTPRDLRQTIYGGYVQDDYRLRKNLTLNIGLRYEMATVPTETANRFSTLVNFTDTAAKIGSPYFSNPTLRNFAPRVGFAWDPFGTGKTSIRGAFGMYDVLPLPYEFELLTLLSQPFTVSGNFSFPAGSSGGFPNGGFPQLTVTTLRNGYVEPNPHRSYVEQWTFGVQRELFRSFTVTAAYVGSHGVHLPFHSDEINDVQPTSTSAGWLWPLPPAAGQPALPKLFPNLKGQVSAVMWSAVSTYHGLNFEAIKRLSHGVQIQGSYTFSKGIDTSSSGIAGDTFGNSVSSLPTFDPRMRRGLSDFDVRHLLTISGLWMIPTPQGWSGAPKWVASGWQLGGVFMASSGLPITPTIGGDPLGLNGADVYAFPDRIPGCNPVNSGFKSTVNGPHYFNLSCFTLPNAPASFAASCTTFSKGTVQIPAGQIYCSNLLGNGGRNTVIGPNLRDVDLSLFKNNPVRRISETFNVQFRWEVFNIFNHANFNPPLPGARQIFSSTGTLNNAGALTASSGTSTTSRQMQFAVKFIW